LSFNDDLVNYYRLQTHTLPHLIPLLHFLQQQQRPIEQTLNNCF